MTTGWTFEDEEGHILVKWCTTSLTELKQACDPRDHWKIIQVAIQKIKEVQC